MDKTWALDENRLEGDEERREGENEREGSKIDGDV